MEIVRDLDEFRCALSRRCSHIEARGVLAHEVTASRQAAMLAAVCAGALAAVGVLALVALVRPEYADALVAPMLPVAFASIAVALVSGAYALGCVGLAAFRAAVQYRSVHERDGVIILRRRMGRG